ncbi:HlyD family type I secretion periplasmic adaptor subunit [Hyphomicrobium sp.]|uniref:HlyD family type I secretion periplasmic adaptor subunit n=1 Tax=Hyphomicrobium sp. TaxID=82 RepID=UPI0025C08E5E|nr:HlyD family type I secretion periplasmic adaptor subunit [Hyphomicrobium sp.]
MSLAHNLESAVKSLNRHAGLGIAATLLVVGATASWASLAQIQDAVIAQGTVAVNSQKKRVQHPDGGIVSEINVDDGSHVESGAILFRLDGKQLSADMGTLRRRIFELAARRWRLQAERDGKGALPDWLPPKEAGDETGDDPDLKAVADGQRQLFSTKLEVIKQQKAQLREQINQLQQQVVGLNYVEEARNKQLGIARQEMAKLSELAKTGLVPLTRWGPIQREEVGLVGEVGQAHSEIAKAKGRISELELRLIELEQDYRKEALVDLQAVEGELSQLAEKRSAIQTKLQRLDVRAPATGRIHELAVHTVGGVVGAGDTLAYIIPDNDKLIVDALVPPKDIDRVHNGSLARIRFTSFDRTTTPELRGTVLWISPDQELVGEYKRPAFRVRIDLDPEEVARLKDAKIGPGMEAEVMLTGSERTALSFIMKPMTDQLHHAFRER